MLILILKYLRKNLKILRIGLLISRKPKLMQKFNSITNNLKKMNMKRIWNVNVLSMVIGVMVIGALTAQAQDEAPITDEELMKYALVMDYANQEKDRLKVDYNAMIQAEELMGGGRRFKELKGAKGDEAKLAELEATPEEIEVFNKIE